MTERTTPVLAIADRLDIMDLYSRWCVTIDDGDVDGWAGTFAPDGIFRLDEHGVRAEGTQGLRDLAAAIYAHDQGLNRHAHHNILISVEDLRVRARADVHVLELRTGGDARIIKTSRYRDRLVRHDGRWLFAERVQTWDTPEIPVQPDVATERLIRER